MRQLLFSYGGPSGENVIEDTQEIAIAIIDCEDFYFGRHQVYTFKLKKPEGVNFYLHITWPHVFLSITFDDQSKFDASDKFYKDLKSAMEALSDSEYKLLSNNCVTVTAKVIANALALNDTNENFPENLILPYSLKRNLEKYSANPESGITDFKEDLTYMKNLKKNNPRYQFWFRFKKHQSDSFMGFFKKRFSYWHGKSYEDIEHNEILNNALGKNDGYKGERTLSVLIEMGWLVRDKEDNIEIGKSAPDDFRKSYNNMLCAKNDAAHGIKLSNRK